MRLIKLSSLAGDLFKTIQSEKLKKVYVFNVTIKKEKITSYAKNISALHYLKFPPFNIMAPAT